MLKVLGLISNIEEHNRNIIISEENISQEFRLKKIVGIRNYLFKEINQSELMGKKHERVCRVSSYMDHLLYFL